MTVADELRRKYVDIALRLATTPPASLAAAVAETLKRGKRDQLRSGRDAAGRSFAAIAPATRGKGRRVSDVPLYGLRGEASPLLTAYEADVRPKPGGLDVTAGWPSIPHVRFLRDGTRRMPRRDPGGFREQDLQTIRERLRRWRDGDPG